MEGRTNLKKKSRKLALWLGMGIPGAIVFCASVPVEQARSNIAGWLHIVGVDRVPELLQTAQADVVSFLVGLVGFAGTLITAIITHRSAKKVEREELESIRLISDAAAKLHASVVKMPKPKNLPGHRGSGRFGA
jgi:hypothetical protein